MKTISTATDNLAPARQRGFTLIELMIAIVISIFLAGGLLMMVQSTRNAFGNQNLLAQLQDNERLAMTFMTHVTESTGYFPDPVNNSNSLLLPITGVFLSAGQGAFGTFSAGATGDTITVRYAAAAGDNNLFNCMGVTNTAAAIDVFTNTFAVNTVNGQPQLQCTATSSLGTFAPTTVTLVNGVTNLKILYGVKRNTATSTGSCADTYLKGNQMLNADWLNLCSVNVSITFTNPIPPQNPPTITIQRVIATMNAAGVNS
jgi:type IV pilus assembly protein PilW